ncbi:hypothetical protein D3C86_2037090 [compost metagenome]
MVAHLAADRQTVLARQHQVENHQIRLLLEDARGRLCAVALDAHRQTIALQVITGQLGQALVVFDDKDVPGVLLLHGCLRGQINDGGKDADCSNADRR